jgi:hypothetical protein
MKSTKQCQQFIKTSYLIIKKKQKAISELVNFIQKTIIIENVIYIQDLSHSYDQLRALKKRLASIDAARIMIIEVKYKHLCWESRQQDMKIFLIQWERVYVEIKRYKLFEISENKTLRNFLVFLSVRENQYFNVQLMILKSTDDDLLEIIISFRQYVRMRETKNI